MNSLNKCRLRLQNVMFLSCEILRHFKTYPLACRCAHLISGEEMGHKVNFDMQHSLATLRQHSLCVSRSIPLLRLIWFDSKLKILGHPKIKTFIVEIKLFHNSCNLFMNKKNEEFQVQNTVNYCLPSCTFIIIAWKLNIVVWLRYTVKLIILCLGSFTNGHGIEPYW